MLVIFNVCAIGFPLDIAHKLPAGAPARRFARRKGEVSR